MQRNGTAPPSRSVHRLLGILLAALLLFRRPGSLLHPQFWAEDGTLFFQTAFNDGFLSTILQPASGYLHSFPRLVAGLSLLFPMELAPLVFNLAAFGVQLLPALYLLSPRMTRLIPSFPLQATAALLYVSLPATYETHVNLTNSHWHLALTVVCILVARPATDARVRSLETFIAALFSLTGPFSILFLPLVAPRLFGLVKGAQPVRSQIVSVVIAAGALLQLGFAATSARIGATAVTFDPLSLLELLRVISTHTFFNTIFGINGFARFHQTLPSFAYGLGLCGLAFFLAVAARDRTKPLLILFYLATLSIALAFIFPLNDPRLWLHPQAGPRYFLFACVFILFSILHLAFATRTFRGIGYALLATTVVVGIPADFFHPEQPDVRWADNAAVFQSLPAGSAFYVPVVPLYHGGMVLHKKSARRSPSPLSRLHPVASATPSDFSVSRPATVGLGAQGNDKFLSVTGWAIDDSSRGPAAGVLVIVDDKVFPAVSGLPAGSGSGECSQTNCGFSRLIPIDEIGPGSHQVSIAVITRDGSGYYQPAPPRTFTTSELFPERGDDPGGGAR